MAAGVVTTPCTSAKNSARELIDYTIYIIHTYTHTHTYTRIHKHTNIYTYIHTHTHTYVHTYICIHTYTYVHTYVADTTTGTQIARVKRLALCVRKNIN